MMIPDPETCAVGIVTFLLALAYTKSRRPRNAPPGPFVWPFVGNLFDVTLGENFHFKAHEYFRKYGPLTSVQMAFYPAVILSDKEVIKEALVDRADVLGNRPEWLPLRKLFIKDKGILFANHNPWTFHKKVILNSFRELGFGSATLEDKIHCEVHAVIHELEKVDGKEFDFKFLFNMATANVICAVILGKRFEYSDEEFLYILSRLNRLTKEGGFKNETFLFLPKWALFLLPLVKRKSSQLRKIVMDWRELLMKWVQQHKATLESGQPRDFVDIALEAGISDGSVRQLSNELFLAGSETTSTTLLWAFLFMVQHPQVQERCRQEIHELVGSDRLPTMVDKNNLPYTSATIMEVQRLANVVPVSILLFNCDKTLQLRGYTLQKDTLIMLNLYSVHMDPKNWDQPEEFRPERFLSTDHKTVIKPEAFMPFSIGKKSCLGENLAKMELFLIFSALIQKFRFTAVDPDKLPTLKDCIFGATLFPGQYSVFVKTL